MAGRQLPRLAGFQARVLTLIFGAVTLASVGLTPATGQPAGGRVQANDQAIPFPLPPGIYTYDEVVAAGFDQGLRPEDVGLPVCKVDPTWEGLKEGSPPAPADGPTECVADATKFLYGYGIGIPDTGYHHNGYKTSASNYAGGKIEVEAQNSTVDHNPSISEFVVSRVLTVRTNGEWIEVGTAEHSDRTATFPEVYTFETGTSTWAFAPGYGLTIGSYYPFRTRNCTVSGDDRQCAEIYWAGQWQLLRNSNAADCRTTSGDAICKVEEFTEIFSDQSADPHPDLSSAAQGNRVDWRSTQLRTDNPAIWVLWTHSSTSSFVTPYLRCLINAYYRFYVVKGPC